MLLRRDLTSRKGDTTRVRHTRPWLLDATLLGASAPSGRWQEPLWKEDAFDERGRGPSRDEEDELAAAPSAIEGLGSCKRGVAAHGPMWGTETLWPNFRGDSLLGVGFCGDSEFSAPPTKEDASVKLAASARTPWAVPVVGAPAGSGSACGCRCGANDEEGYCKQSGRACCG